MERPELVSKNSLGLTEVFKKGVTLTLLLMGILGVLGWLANGIYQFQDSVVMENLPEIDAIICLGGGRGRIQQAAEIWYRYWQEEQEIQGPFLKVPMLYLAGMGQHSSWHQLSKLIPKLVAAELGPEWVMVENRSGNTEENARFLAHMVRHLDWKRLLLITSSYHMRRAYYIFQQTFQEERLSVTLDVFSVKQEPFKQNQWWTDRNAIRVTFQEYWKWIYYRYFHPKASIKA